MRVSLKVLMIAWAILFLIIGGLLFNAYSKLKPETFIALLTEQVQKNYPGSKLNVGNISYRFSLDFNLNLQDIHLRRNDKLLASIGEVELKVPWWLLLANHGNAQINLKNLDIYVDHDSVEQVHESILPKTEKIKVVLPKYLSDANFTLRAKQISIRDIQNARRYFVVSKLLVREFQYGKNSAFEVNIPVIIKHKESQFNADLWLFGDVTPEASSWQLNYRGEFRTRENNDKFKIEDLVIGGAASFAPSAFKVSSNFKLEIDKQTAGTGTFSADQELLSFDLKLSSFPLNYFAFLYEEIKNPYLLSPQGNARGSVKFTRAFDSAFSSVSGNLNFEGNLQVSEKDTIPGSWKIGFQDTKWEVSFMSPKGEASFFRRSVLDPKTSTLSQFSEELGFSGLDLAVIISPVVPMYKFLKEDQPAYFTTTISYKDCLIGEQKVQGEFKYGRTPEQKYYSGQLQDIASSIKISYSDKGINNFEMNAKAFNWHPAYQFLNPLFHASSGTLDGKIQGMWTSSWEAGQWLIQMKTLGITGPQGKLPDFISNTASFFNINPVNTKSLNLNLSGKNGIINLNSLMLENTESVKITGSLSSKQKSHLTASFPKNKKLKPIKKEVIEPYWMQKEDL